MPYYNFQTTLFTKRQVLYITGRNRTGGIHFNRKATPHEAGLHNSQYKKNWNEKDTYLPCDLLIKKDLLGRPVLYKIHEDHAFNRIKKPANKQDSIRFLEQIKNQEDKPMNQPFNFNYNFPVPECPYYREFYITEHLPRTNITHGCTQEKDLKSNSSPGKYTDCTMNTGCLYKIRIKQEKILATTNNERNPIVPGCEYIGNNEKCSKFNGFCKFFSKCDYKNNGKIIKHPKLKDPMFTMCERIRDDGMCLQYHNHCNKVNNCKYKKDGKLCKAEEYTIPICINFGANGRCKDPRNDNQKCYYIECYTYVINLTNDPVFPINRTCPHFNFLTKRCIESDDRKLCSQIEKCEYKSSNQREINKEHPSCKKYRNGYCSDGSINIQLCNEIEHCPTKTPDKYSDKPDYIKKLHAQDTSLTLKIEALETYTRENIKELVDTCEKETGRELTLP